MIPDEKEFLLTEYRASWDTIQNIDNRRDRFVSYYALLYGGVTSVIAALLNAPGMLQARGVRIGIIVLILATAMVGVTIIGILWSERDANIRYRERVNWIRKIFLSGATLPSEVAKYFEEERKHDPHGLGRTLRWVFTMLVIQIVIALLAALAVACDFLG